MIAESIPTLKSMPMRDKYLLANELWDEIEANESAIPVDDKVIAAIEERYENYLRDPSRLISWETLKERLGK
jgi:putative addiction module component (TIGR02574 family)